MCSHIACADRDDQWSSFGNRRAVSARMCFEFCEYGKLSENLRLPSRRESTDSYFSPARKARISRSTSASFDKNT
jgi:hypothetical protein